MAQDPQMQLLVYQRILLYGACLDGPTAPVPASQLASFGR